MESVFAAAAVVLLVALVCLLIVVPTERLRPGRSSRSAGAPGSGGRMEESGHPSSMNAFWADPRPGEDRKVHWRRPLKRDANVVPGADSAEWTEAFTRAADSWDPYDPRGEHRKRVRGARQRRGRALRLTGDYYSLLGVDVSATEQEIERAYRAKAAQVHPDRFFGDPDKRGEAEELLKRLNAAAEVLRDPERRAEYDSSP